MNSDRYALAHLTLDEGLNRAKDLAEYYKSTKLVRVIAEEVWSSASDAQEWMLKPHPLLKGKVSSMC